MRNLEGIKTELQKKVQRKICVRNITFWLHPLRSMSFLLAFSSTSLPKCRTYWMIKVRIATDCILCDVVIMKISCNVIAASWHLQERNIILDFFLASSVLAMTLN